MWSLTESNDASMYKECIVMLKVCFLGPECKLFLNVDNSLHWESERFATNVRWNLWHNKDLKISVLKVVPCLKEIFRNSEKTFAHFLYPQTGHGYR